MNRLRASASILWVAVALGASRAHADVAVHQLARAQRLSGLRAGTPRGVLGQPELSAIVELPDGADASGVTRIGPHFGAARGSLEELDALSSAHPSWQVTWSAPLRPLMDRAALWAGAPAFRNETGLAGKGAIVGVIDTGADIAHPDLRNADGSTRIAYYIDYGQGPRGLQPDAESHCTMDVPCAVYGSDEINGFLKSGTTGTIPGDVIGHGTHVTSLAAGNGGAKKRYVGIAPEATLIVARAIDASNQISDVSVLSAASLVFALADQLGKPCVLNLSLGSNFGPHDGTSALERGLAEFVGDAHPGRAIVVAAGNSAGLFSGQTAFPTPLGTHTDVSVPRGSTVRVPIVTPPPPGAGDTISGTIFAWIAFRPDDFIGVGVDRRDGGVLAPVQFRGGMGSYGVKDVLTATVVDGSLSSLGIGVDDANAAAVIIEGTWPKDETFSLRLTGSGSASMWVDAVGQIGSDGGGIGALFPASTKESTITLPAAHPDLIAVGATINRTTWTDRLGDPIAVASFGGVVDPALDSLGFFSSAGPTSDLRMKPDLVAPGAFVAGALSQDADPRTSSASIFGSNGTCTPAADCSVVDDQHAVTVGTSMASPIVAGAVALLFEQNPTLTSGQVRTLLQAGARHPEGSVPLQAQLGAGALDLKGTLDVEAAMESAVVREPAAGDSFLSLGATYAHPDPTWSVPALLKLKDAQGHPADGFDTTKLVVNVEHGRVSGDVTQEAPGLFRLAVAANDRTGGASLDVEVRYDGKLVAAESLPIAVDVSTAREGFAARGGCTIARANLLGRAPKPDGARATPILSLLALALGVTAWRSRRCTSVARKARNPGRRGSSARDRRGSSRRREGPHRR